MMRLYILKDKSHDNPAVIVSQLLLKWCGIALLVVWVNAGAYADMFDARLTDFSGDVTVFSGTEHEEPFDPVNNMVLRETDRVVTEKHGSAEITLHGEAVFSIEENSDVVISSLDAAQAGIIMRSGLILFTIAELLTSTDELTIQTQTMVAAVRGTEGAVEAYNPGVTVCGVFGGSIAVRSLKVSDDPSLCSVMLKTGMETRVGKNQFPEKPKPLQKRMQRHRRAVRTLAGRLKKIKKQWRQIIRERTQPLRKRIYRRKKRIPPKPLPRKRKR
ncbi:MAG: hypothetical protein GF384_06755 [Elusimicrobia bacterium]|nr:hypothetical protein [Elusimicrobiota bacterium]MBD3412400.1 hypothetical protein [Elusimicrobiota bacterium]